MVTLFCSILNSPRNEEDCFIEFVTVFLQRVQTSKLPTKLFFFSSLCSGKKRFDYRLGRRLPRLRILISLSYSRQMSEQNFKTGDSFFPVNPNTLFTTIQLHNAYSEFWTAALNELQIQAFGVIYSVFLRLNSFVANLEDFATKRRVKYWGNYSLHFHTLVLSLGTGTC
jgi:hypothetical protein